MAGDELCVVLRLLTDDDPTRKGCGLLGLYMVKPGTLLAYDIVLLITGLHRRLCVCVCIGWLVCSIRHAQWGRAGF